jgi:hypothetical protein
VHKLLLAAILLAAVFPASGQVRYFPSKVFSSDDVQLDQFVSDWYSSKLKILEEPSLLEMAVNRDVETYRFLWLRTFHNPVAVRLEFAHDGSTVLFAKVATGTGGFPDKKPHLLQNFSRPVSAEQAKSFQQLLEKVDFWALPTEDMHRGEDGAEWIFEGVKQGTYHVVVRWTPEQGKFRELGMMLALGFADLRIPKEEIY